jgi:hypothetical protein
MNENEKKDENPAERFTLGSPVTGDPNTPNVGPTPAGPFLIAGLSETEGNLGELTDAKLTRWEVEHIVRYWYDSYQSVCDLGAMGYSGSWECRMADYAYYRADTLFPFCSESFQEWLKADHQKQEEERDELEEHEQDERHVVRLMDWEVEALCKINIQNARGTPIYTHEPDVIASSTDMERLHYYEQQSRDLKRMLSAESFDRIAKELDLSEEQRAALDKPLPKEESVDITRSLTGPSIRTNC